MLKNILLVFIVACAFLSCTKETLAPAKSLDLEYYPLKNNLVWIYDVDSTFYNDFNGGVTNYKFEIKDSISSSYVNLTKDTVYRVDRYKKSQNETEWSYQKSYTKGYYLRSAEEIIDNQKFVKLIFPPVIGGKWNGNSKNNLEEQIYTISEILPNFNLNNLSFDSTLVVEQINEVNLITENIVKEIYSKNKGLIKKEIVDIEKNISTGAITHGTIYIMQLKHNN